MPQGGALPEEGEEVNGLLSVDPFSMPASAGPSDRFVGMSEYGTPMMETPTGQRYTVRPQAERMTQRPEPRPEPQGLLSYGDARRAARSAPGAIRQGDTGVIGGLLGAMVQGLTAPGRAARGEPVTLGDAWATALDYGVMGAPMKAPEGSMRMFAARDGGTIDDAVEFSRSGNAIFHSGHAPLADDLHRFGVDPGHGPWVREVLAGAVDDVDAHLDGVPAASWWDSQPQWIKAKVARAAGKYVDDVTVEDIRQHGHLVIADASEYSDDLYRIPQRGIDEGEYSRISTWGGDERRLYETPLYEYDDAAMAGRYTEGLEPNDIVTTEVVDPLFSLTGDELVEFLRKRGDIGESQRPSPNTKPKLTIDDLRESARKRRAERERVSQMLLQDDKAVRMTDGRLKAIVSPAADRPGKWRVTYMDEKGPMGHTDAEDKADAVAKALERQFWPESLPQQPRGFLE